MIYTNNKSVNTATIYYKRQGIILLICGIFSLLVFGFIGISNYFGDKETKIDLIAYIAGSIFVGIFIFLTIKSFANYNHFRKVNLKYIQTVKVLDVDYKNINRSTIHRLGFDVEKGFITERVYTDYIFLPRGPKTLLVENYTDATIKVGYDEERDVWVAFPLSSFKFNKN